MLKLTRLTGLSVAAAVLAAGSLAGAAPAHATAYDTRHYYVDGRVVEQTARHQHSFVRDAEGRSHVAVVGGEKRLTYETRAHGSDVWVKRGVAGLTSSSRYSKVKLALSPDRRRLYLAVTCVGGQGLRTGLYVLTKLVGASRFTRPTRHDRFQSGCTGPVVQGLVGLPHRRVGILFFVDGGKHLAYASGVPGHSFRVHQFPGNAGELASDAFMVRDSATGELSVAAYFVEKGGPGLYVFNQRTGQAAWSRPHRLQKTPANGFGGSLLVSLAAGGGHVWIGLQQLHPQPYGAFLIGRTKAGHWSRPHRVPHSTTRSNMGPMVATRQGALHVLYVANGIRDAKPNPGGVRHLFRSRTGVWSHPDHLSDYSNDGPEDIAAVPHRGFRWSCVCNPPAGGTTQ